MLVDVVVRIKLNIVTVTSSPIPTSMQTFSVMTMLEVFVVFHKTIIMLSAQITVALLANYRVNHSLVDLLG